MIRPLSPLLSDAFAASSRLERALARLNEVLVDCQGRPSDHALRRARAAADAGIQLMVELTAVAEQVKPEQTRAQEEEAAEALISQLLDRMARRLARRTTARVGAATIA